MDNGAQPLADATLAELCTWHMNNDFDDKGSIRKVRELVILNLKITEDTLRVAERYEIHEVLKYLKEDIEIYKNYISWSSEMLTK